MKKLAQKLLEEKRIKATDMIGKKLEVLLSRKAVSIDSEKKTAIFVMSTSNIDRHGDIVDQESWILKYFEQNPMFFLQHRSDQFPIGKWLRVWFEDDPDNLGKKMMLGEAQFATDIYDQADLAFKMVEGGYMGAVSVGFIPHRVEYDEEKDAFVLYDCELLECSLVGVGSNRQALIKDNNLKEEREVAIEACKAIDSIIKKKDNQKVISHIKARENLNKAIRRMRAL